MKDIATPSKTKEILTKYHLNAKKGFGQNFLIDTNIIHNIVDYGITKPKTGVIEIGPGIGALTQQIARCAHKVVCFEIDLRLEEVLAETLSEFDHIQIYFEDFLKADVNAIIEKEFKDCDEVVLIANLPYYITTPILIKIFEENIKVAKIVAMMQKEVAMRLCGTPSTKDYNSLSVLTQYYSDPKIVINVPKNVFIPAPNVDSAVVLFDIYDQKKTIKNEKLFFEILRLSFSNRRKTILNNLNLKFNDKETTKTILENSHINPIRRAETLSLDEFIQLADYLQENGYGN